MNDKFADPDPELKLAVPPELRASSGLPVTFTVLLNVTVTLIIAPTVYDPFAVVDVTFVITAAVPVFVRVKLVVALPAVTPTEYVPTFPFAVNVPGSAIPLAFALMVVVPVVLPKVPLWPLLPVVAVNTTEE